MRSSTINGISQSRLQGRNRLHEDKQLEKENISRKRDPRGNQGEDRMWKNEKGAKIIRRIYKGEWRMSRKGVKLAGSTEKYH